MTASFGEIMAQNRPQLTDENHRYNSYRFNSYRNDGDKTQKTTRASLPEWLQPVVQNDSWAIRYKKLLDEAPAELRALVDYAVKNARDVFRYMNTACSKTNWVSTLKKWKRSIMVACTASEVIKRIGARKTQYKAVYKALWGFGDGVLRHAVTAQEIGKDPFKLFCWLVWRGGSGGVETK